ncbi:MAG: hypothetical protein K0Q84_185 [Arthrobacter sp.]|nr:hypothetical protein [Arthrobacter sp.]
MTATLTDRATLFLRRAGLLAGLLAIIAGIVGMHILTGSHNVHMTGSSAAAQPHHGEQTHHGVQPHHGAQTGTSVPAHHPVQPHDVVAEHSVPSSYGGQDQDNQANAVRVTAGVNTSSDPAPTAGTFSCLGGDPCAGMSAVGGSCIPSGSTGSLAAPPPSTVSFAADTQAPVAVASSYTHLPESPSPADLCISRT